MTVTLISEMTTKGLMIKEHIYTMDMLEKGHHVLCKTGQHGVGFHPATQNRVQFKTYELFIYGIFNVIFSDHSGLRVTETMESETVDKGGLPYIMQSLEEALSAYLRGPLNFHCFPSWRRAL